MLYMVGGEWFQLNITMTIFLENEFGDASLLCFRICVYMHTFVHTTYFLEYKPPLNRSTHQTETATAQCSSNKKEASAGHTVFKFAQFSNIIFQLTNLRYTQTREIGQNNTCDKFSVLSTGTNIPKMLTVIICRSMWKKPNGELYINVQ